jgi:bacterioferritin (cytochrome b1)
MGNLILKNKLVTREKEKAMLQEELDKERDFQKGYKHNVKIWRGNRAKVKQKYIYSLRYYKMKMKSSRVAQQS